MIGARLFYGTQTFAFAGLGVVIAYLEARLGALPHGRLNGLAHDAPRLTFYSGLMVLALLGVPGSPAFFAQDLLLRGALISHPWAALVILLARMLTSIALARSFASTFFGPSVVRYHPLPRPLARETATLTLMLLAMLSLHCVS